MRPTEARRAYYEEAIPAEKVEKARKWRARIWWKNARGKDDGLLEKFLEPGRPDDRRNSYDSPQGHHCAARGACVCGSGFKNKGIQRLLDARRVLPAGAQ